MRGKNVATPKGTQKKSGSPGPSKARDCHGKGVLQKGPVAADAKKKPDVSPENLYHTWQMGVWAPPWVGSEPSFGTSSLDIRNPKISSFWSATRNVLISTSWPARPYPCTSE